MRKPSKKALISTSTEPKRPVWRDEDIVYFV